MIDGKFPMEFELNWRKNFSHQIFQHMMETLYGFKCTSNDQNKYLHYLCRCVQKFLQNPEHIAQYETQILKLFEDNFSLVLMQNEDDIDTYENNPVEYLNQNDLNVYNIHRRVALISVASAMANGGLFQKMLQILARQLQSTQDELLLESLLFIMQKMLGMRDHELDQSFVDNLYASYLIPLMANPQTQGYLKARVCYIIKDTGSLIKDEQVIQQVVQGLC